MPEELREQVPLIKEVLKAMNIAVIEQAGLEADDLLGTLAKKSEAMGMDVSRWNRGIYLLRCIAPNGSVHTEKLIICHRWKTSS